MRPITRGVCPIDDDDRQRVFSEYTEARGELIKRLGQYCSYCETRLNASLAVEHVRPKSPPGANQVDEERALDWDNFLLACVNCNSTKGNRDVILGDYVWPDRDNTFRAFQYEEGGVVRQHRDAPVDVQQRAQAMIALVGLDKTPLNDVKASDRRWLNRKEAWNIASRSQARIAQNDTEELRGQVVETACSQGFWSVWMTVFQDDPDMLFRLIKAVPGTCNDCFDFNNGCHLVQRHQGAC